MGLFVLTALMSSSSGERMHLHFSSILLALLSGTSAFIFDQTCHVPLRCSCALPFIKCEDRMLPRVPNFNMTTNHSSLYLQLQNNRILLVQDSAFDGLKTDKLYLDMSVNRIHSIGDNAFSGLEDAITVLKLEHNMLTSIPKVLANLTKLTILHIHDNPIQTFDGSVMSALGDHLETFYVGSHELTIWPDEFRYLETLSTLYLFNLSMVNIPHDGFRGFERSLIHLVIDGTKFTTMPDPICSLTSLRDIYFTNNSNDHPHIAILPDCPAPLQSVTGVFLDGNNLTKFPNVFKTFPSVGTLDISNNPYLRSIDVDFNENTTLITLVLNNNGFNHVPYQLGKLTQLKNLQLSGNDLREIWNGDLRHLTHISRLDFSQNPIRIIEDSAFENLSSVYFMDLHDTNLKTLPQAVSDLDRIQTLQFSGNTVNCDCKEMSWMHNWTNINSVKVSGECSKPFGMSIQTFLSYGLDSC